MQQGGYPQPPPKPKSGAAPWIIGCAVVGGLGIVIVGILAVLAIHGTRKYIATAKTIEARSTLTEIGLDAQTAFERESPGTALQKPGLEKHALCASASRSVPASITSVRGVKYQSAASDWTVDAATNAGFSCLKFEMTAPQYYLYSYTATPPGTAVGNGFEATAQGDLNGDGTTSKFSLTGKIVPGGSLVVAPSIAETNPSE
jgi:type IV pilus assembly protein PilA